MITTKSRALTHFIQLLAFAGLPLLASAQTNTFPTSGNVGIGTATPSNLLSVNGVMNAGGSYYNVLSYSLDGTPVYGVKIKTNIPYVSSAEMPTIIIEGYNYGTDVTIGLIVDWYIYNGAFYNYTASSQGGYTPQIQLSDEAGYVVIFINDRQYYQRFAVRAYAQGISEQSNWFNGWSAVDQALSGTNTVTVPYQNSFSGNVTFPGNGIWNPSGNVGIGTTSPTQKLTVAGNTNKSGSWVLGDSVWGANTFEVHNNGWDGVSNGNYGGIAAGHGYFYGGLQSGGNSGSEAGYGQLYVSGTCMLMGNVGIGTTNPSFPLSVNGTVEAKEVIVQTGWSDYVFSPNYRLTPLSEVERQIKTEKHLAGIPSVQEVSEHGIRLGELEAKLLAKIEELTLHQIEQEKRISAQQDEIHSLKAEIAQLSTRN